MLNEIPLLAEPYQKFSTAINERKVSFYVTYNNFSKRFTFNLSIDEVEVLTGMPMIPNVDLLEAFDFGIGKLVFSGTRDLDVTPDMTSVERGMIKLYSLT